MKRWLDRSPEVANLLNPAFGGVVLYAAVAGHEAADAEGLGPPFDVVFLVLPMVLHPPTRQSLPATTRTRLLTWVSNRPDLLIGLAERTAASAPVTRESLLFLSLRRCLRVADGRVATGASKPKMTSKLLGSAGEVRPIVQAATRLGRILASTGDAATLYATLGLRPG